MSKFKKFGEFIKNKKPKELIHADDGLAGKDYDGPLATKPPQEPTPGQNSKVVPYKATGEVERGVVWTAPDDGKEKGLAHDATPGMTPSTSPLGKSIEGNAKQRPKPKKLTSEQFIDATKGMSQTEFANFILESHGNEITTVTDLFGNEFTPDPTQSIQYITGLMLANPVWMERFVREMKRRDGLETLMTEVMDHGEAYDLIVDHFDEPECGSDRVNKFARTLNDRHMKNFDNFDFGDEDEEDMGESVGPSLPTLFGDEKPQGNKKPGGAIGGGSGPDATPDPSYQGGVFAGAGHEKDNPMGAQGMHGPTGNGARAGGQQNPQFPGGQPVMPPKKMKEGSDSVMPRLKNSVGHHLINEMHSFPHFANYMKEKCMGCKK